MKIHITSIFLLFALLSYGQNKTEDTNSSTQYDVSSKEKIKKAMEEIDGKEYSDRSICDRKSRNFDELILIGYFAYDRGCMGDKAFYKGKYVNPVENAATILNDHNWKKNKEQLAIDFTKDVITAWENVLRKYDIKEDSNTFHVPQSKILDNGGVEVICWVKNFLVKVFVWGHKNCLDPKISGKNFLGSKIFVLKNLRSKNVLRLKKNLWSKSFCC